MEGTDRKKEEKNTEEYIFITITLKNEQFYNRPIIEVDSAST